MKDLSFLLSNSDVDNPKYQTFGITIYCTLILLNLLFKYFIPTHLRFFCYEGVDYA